MSVDTTAATATGDDLKPYLADSILRLSLRMIKENPGVLAVVMTTKSGARYIVVDRDGMFVAMRKDASQKPGEPVENPQWFNVGSQIIDFEMVNIWGGLKFGPWTTTDVVKVQLKRRDLAGEASLFTVFER